MKKTLSILLALAMIVSLASMPMSAETERPVLATYDGLDDFYDGSAENSAWKYMYTEDMGETFEVLPVFTERDWGDYWYPNEESYVGLGFNNDVENHMELNVDGPNMITALAFIAPNTNTYIFDSFNVVRQFGQAAETFYIYKNDTEITAVDLDATTEVGDVVRATAIPSFEIALEAGDTLYFYVTPLAGENDEDGDPTYGWLSAYFSNISAVEVDLDQKAAIEDSPWKYMYTEDMGETFEVLPVFTERSWGDYWYPNAESYVGLGFNNDLDGYMELNVDGDSLITVVAFEVPSDGDYTINAFDFAIRWGQAGGELLVYVDETEEINISLEDVEDITTEETLLPGLSEGDMIYFYATSAGGWFSAYFGDIDIELDGSEDVFSSIDDFEVGYWVGEFDLFNDYYTTTALSHFWKYMYSDDDGANFESMTEYRGNAWRVDTTWPDPNNWSGVGFRTESLIDDVRVWLELNTFQSIGALVFAAPSDGDYVIESFTVVGNQYVYNQRNEEMVVKTDSAVLFEGGFPEGDKESVTVPEIEVTLEKGDLIYFYVTGNGSAYTRSPTINLLGEIPVDEDPVDEDPVDEDDLEEEPGDVLPIVAVLASAMTAAGALTLKKRK